MSEQEEKDEEEWSQKTWEDLVLKVLNNTFLHVSYFVCPYELDSVFLYKWKYISNTYRYVKIEFTFSEPNSGTQNILQHLAVFLNGRMAVWSHDH